MHGRRLTALARVQANYPTLSRGTTSPAFTAP